EMSKRGVASEEAWSSIQTLTDNYDVDEKLSKLSSTQTLTVFRDYLGEYGTFAALPFLFSTFLHLHQGNPPTDDMMKAGIKSPGKQGLNDLKQLFRSFKDTALSTEGPIELKSDLEADILSALTRFETSTWSRSEGIRIPVESFNKSHENGNITPLAPNFKEGEMWVDRLDAKALAEFNYGQDVIDSVEQFSEDILAVAHKPPEQVHQEQLAQLQANLEKEAAELKNPLTEEDKARDPDGKRQRGREAKAAQTKKFSEDIRDIKSTDELINAIAKYERKNNPVTTPILRRLIIRRGLDHIQSGDAVVEEAGKSLSKSKITNFAEFFSNAVKEHAVPELEIEEEAKRRVNRIFNTKALSGELGRMESLDTAGKDHFSIKPTRGILGELSGYICDACWTSDEEIMRRYPNITPVIFIRNPGQPTERLAGATMIIKSKTSEGEDAFILRGFNPLENIINPLKAGDFVDQFLEWLTPIAKKEGVTKILMPGGGSGGSQTNRPSINTTVKEKFETTNIVRLASKEDTTFNNHDIIDTCFLVREVPEAA
ncbi:hypothetical protein ACFLRC_04245, partial [Candidatus Altiarchaeota archaeon]